MSDENLPAENIGSNDNQNLVWPLRGVSGASGIMKADVIKAVQAYLAFAGETFRSGSESNNESQKRIYESYDLQIKTLLAKLEKETDPDREMAIIREVNSVQEAYSKKDSENKKHIQKSYTKVLAGLGAIATGVVVGVALVIRGGKLK